MKRLVAAAAAALCLVTAGCSGDSFGGVYDLPLPGGADLGRSPFRVTVQFADVLDLVPQAAVKVADVAVGRVESIELGEDGWTAEVVVAVNGDVVLPANAVARLRQSSLLGEKFVELAQPTAPPDPGQLAEGALIPADRTNRNPEFEEVFGALSMLLNGGGIGQLQTISQELSKVMTGNEQEIRSFLSGVRQLMGNLDTHRTDIVEALDGLNRLATTLAARTGQIDTALDDLAPGMRSLAEQRTMLVSMLQSLDQLSTVAVDTITRSKNDMVADLKALAPIVNRLAEAGQDLPRALEILPTFPFTDPVLDAVKGDYMNIFIEVVPVEPVPADAALPLPAAGTVTNSGGGR